jgi:hypothetical protein
MKKAAIVLALLAAIAVDATTGRIRHPKGNHNRLYVPTPAGRMLRTCVHSVPSGSELEHEVDPATGGETGRLMVKNAQGEIVRILPKCDTSKHPMWEPKQHSTSDVGAPLDYDGWVAYTAFNVTSNGPAATFDSYLGDFTVPVEPTQDPEVLYLFTGLQNINWIPYVDPDPSTPFDIIQPVLQYPGDNGDYWSVKSWYVTLDTGTVASNEVEVNTGDTIFGNMTRTGPTSWFIGSTSVGTQQTTNVSVTNPRLQYQPWAYNTAECYGCIDCTTYPSNSPCKFSQLDLMTGTKSITPQWLVNPQPNPNHFCQESVTVVSPTNVVINFNN